MPVQTIIQIVPTLPPAISGVGDYALLLADELRRTHGIDTHFIVGNPAWQGGQHIEGFAVTCLTERTAESLVNVLLAVANPMIPVLLHYVGYGYEKRGCPVWLARAFSAWRSRQAKNSWLTFFHELSVSGPVLSSSFWLAPLQRWLVSQFARNSSQVLTNRFASSTQLTAMTAGQRVQALPVFSTVGELSKPLPIQARSADLVIFGSKNWVEPLVTTHADQLLKLCQALQVVRLVTIGSQPGTCQNFKFPYIEHGILDAAAISVVMARCRFGMVNYYPGYLGKSTIFAAYAAHALVPVLLTPSPGEDDGLLLGQHYLTPAIVDNCLQPDQVQAIATAAHRWYQGHNVSATAEWFAQAFNCAIV